jgi:SAM-dependent methyltransferase
VARVAEDARSDQKAFYDARFDAGYMEGFEGFFEACRVRSIRHTLSRLDAQPSRCLDYGCGEGRYIDVLREHFPNAALTGSDISAKGLELGREKHPQAEFLLMPDETVPAPDGAFELILSVEVLEHVGDVARATQEIGRLLAPGGVCVITTPCANPGSLEWTMNRLRGGLEPSPDGFGRFATDEPAHLRRLRSRDLDRLLDQAGVEVQQALFRAHLFTTLMTFPRVRRRVSLETRIRIAMLDWKLFRRVPAAATMVLVGQKRH